MQNTPHNYPMQHPPPDYSAAPQTMKETTKGYGASPQIMQNTTPQEQDIHQITSVTIQQPQQVEMQRYARAPENVRDWTAGLCGCFSDVGGCCYAMFCWTCFVAQMSNRMNENACGEIFCGPMFISHLRTKLRTLYGIRGSVCGDICATVYCPFCVATQLMREMRNVNH